MYKKPSYVIELRKVVLDETGLHDAEKISFEISEQKYNGCVSCASHSSVKSSDVLEELRPSVLRFAQAMEQVLKKHDDRDGWKDCGLYWLLDRIHEELKEADEKWDGKNFRGDYNAISEELIDVANFCMMFWDNTHPELRQHKERE
jgi:NTP pyrophosphatase (non-canonical NTP hydrolase)